MSNNKRLSFKLGIIVLTLLIILPMISIIHLKFSIPNEIIISRHSNVSYKLLPFTTAVQSSNDNLSDNLITTSGNTVNFNTDNIGNYCFSISLFDTIPVKDVNVSVQPKKYVIPLGNAIGIKLYTNGVLVVDISDTLTTDNKTLSPAKAAGIKAGDVITEINGTKIDSIEQMTKLINNSEGELSLVLNRNGELFKKTLTAVKTSENIYKIGMWVRDTAAGVGTMTFYDPDTNKYACLGHAITDVDTGSILSAKSGSILSCNIVSVTKGSRGKPGELIGSFTNEVLGNIQLNCPFGIYGEISDKSFCLNKEQFEVASRFQINEGDAHILTDIDGNGVKQYSVSIQKISEISFNDNKGMVIKITDPELIHKTGGIVQGMSGSPIIQDGKLVGAVTHVFINDPTKGYGIFAENMIDTIYTLN